MENTIEEENIVMFLKGKRIPVIDHFELLIHTNTMHQKDYSFLYKWCEKIRNKANLSLEID